MLLKLKTKSIIAAGVFAAAGFFGVLSAPAYASCEVTGYNTTDGSPIYGNKTTDEKCGSAVEDGMRSLSPEFGNRTNLEGTVVTVVHVILYIVGILAVVMIIIGGIQYTTSAGDQNAVTKAKNTILYGIVGLVIAVLAYAIVSFVISRLK